MQDEGLSGGYKGAVHWKRAGEPSMGLTNTQTKLGKEEGMSYNGTGPHARFKEPVRNTERGREMDLLGSIVVVAVGGGDWYMCWAKGHRVFSAIHLKANCAAQAGAVKLHLGVWSGFYVGPPRKRAYPCSMCGPMLKVRLKRRREGIVLE